jgi:hypothetical protein
MMRRRIVKNEETPEGDATTLGTSSPKTSVFSFMLGETDPPSGVSCAKP